MNDETTHQRPLTAQTTQTTQTTQSAQVYQTPDWEIPRTPITKPKRSALAGLKDNWPLRNETPLGKETFSRLPTNNSSIDLGTTKPKPAFLVACSARLDKVLPPEKKYLGLSRKRFLLFVVLPLLVLFLLVLPIALGVGLSKNGKKKDLPIDTGGVWEGELTYYAPGLGACGWVSAADENIVALSHLLFDQFQAKGADPNQNMLCGKRIRIQRDFVESGKGVQTVDVTVVDRCTGCDWTDLDVSLGVFERLAREEDGRVSTSWAWLDYVDPPQ